MKNGSFLVAAAVLAFSLEASAQEADIEAGAAYANKVCAACHAVLPNEPVSPLPEAEMASPEIPSLVSSSLTAFARRRESSSL